MIHTPEAPEASHLRAGQDVAQWDEVRLFLCADEEELLCRSVWSERSGVGSTDRAASQCRLREEMMSCSGHAPDGAPAGQRSAVSSGSPYNTCVEVLAFRPASLFTG